MNEASCTAAPSFSGIAPAHASIQALRDRYASDRLAVLRQLADHAEVDRILKESSAWPRRTVIVRQGDPASWLSQQAPTDSFLHASYLSYPTLDMVRTISAAASTLVTSQCWTNIYRAGEYISRHRDAGGSVQLMLCLASPPPECGGVFMASIQGMLREIHLDPGDAVLFQATAVEHQTTPLLPSPACPDPLRITAVMRYFFAESLRP
jgi:hypothetical protein